ncbi:MAG: hypothetical protein CM15mV12_3350 [uncultured marine virus]|nr:MAG: hypothetical protein CM15mV12_3350 [uncultured marine virus]
MTNGGIEQESIGAAYLEEHHGGTWVKYSYNTIDGKHLQGKLLFSGHAPSADGNWKYDSTNDIFCEINPPTDKDGESCASWT